MMSPARWVQSGLAATCSSAAAVLTAAAGLFWLSPVYRDALATTLIGVVICLSVVVITGYLGQISLAPLTFAGISAFMVAELSLDQGWPFPWPILTGAHRDGRRPRRGAARPRCGEALVVVSHPMEPDRPAQQDDTTHHEEGGDRGRQR